MNPTNQHQMLDEIDERQDEVIRQLDDLNEQVERLLQEFQKRPAPQRPPPKAGERRSPAS